MPTCRGMITHSLSPVDIPCQAGGARVWFADAAARARLGGAGTLVLRIEKIGPAVRGRLSDVIDEASTRRGIGKPHAGSPGLAGGIDRRQTGRDHPAACRHARDGLA